MQVLVPKERGLLKVKTRAASGCNSLCGSCLRGCRQAAAVLLVECPRYLPRPFKVHVYRFDQLELFGREDG